MASRTRFGGVVVVPIGLFALVGACTSFKASDDPLDASTLDATPIESGVDSAPPGNDSDADDGPTSTFACPAGDLLCDDYERSMPMTNEWVQAVNLGTKLEIDRTDAFTGQHSLVASATPSHQMGQGAYLEHEFAKAGTTFEIRFAMKLPATLPTGRVNLVAVDFSTGAAPKQTLAVAIDRSQGLVLTRFAPDGDADAGAEKRDQGPPAAPGWHEYLLRVTPNATELTVDGASRLVLTVVTTANAQKVRLGLPFADAQSALYTVNIDSVVVPR